MSKLKKYIFTGERMFNHPNSVLYKMSYFRYKFALKFLKKTDITLDIACGSGYGTNLLSTKTKMTIGVDNDPKTIKFCQSKYKSSNLKFIKLNAENKNKKFKNYFDSIISFETIEHLKDYKKFLDNLNYYIKPKGIIILSTPNNYIHQYPPSNKFHYQEFDIKDLYKIIKKKFYLQKIYIYGQNKTSQLSSTKINKNNNRNIIASIFKLLYDFDQKYIKLFNKIEHYKLYQIIGNLQRQNPNNFEIYPILNLSKPFFQPSISIFIIKMTNEKK